MIVNTVPYDFEAVEFTKPLPLRGYYVRIFCFFDGEKVHHFFHQSECLENMCLARECGYYTTPIIQKFFVSELNFPQIFNEIEEYVRRSNSYQESEL